MQKLGIFIVDGVDVFLAKITEHCMVVIVMLVLSRSIHWTLILMH